MEAARRQSARSQRQDPHAPYRRRRRHATARRCGRETTSATLTMRKLVARNSSAATSPPPARRCLSSVGAYQLEALGIQLFEKIDGDYFSILGLPLLPLLDTLRREGVIEAEDAMKTRLRHRLAGRAFPLAADPRLLAEALRHRRRLRAGGVAPEDLAGFLGLLAATWLCRRQCHLAAQGSGVAPAAMRRRGGASDRRRQHAVARRRGGSAASNTDAYGFMTNLEAAGARTGTRTAPGHRARRRRRGAGHPARPLIEARLRAILLANRTARPRRGSGRAFGAGGRRWSTGTTGIGALAGCRPARQHDQPRHDRQADRSTIDLARSAGRRRRRRHRLRAARDRAAGCRAGPRATGSSTGSACCCTRPCRASSAGSAFAPR